MISQTSLRAFVTIFLAPDKGYTCIQIMIFVISKPRQMMIFVISKPKHIWYCGYSLELPRQVQWVPTIYIGVKITKYFLNYHAIYHNENLQLYVKFQLFSSVFKFPKQCRFCLICSDLVFSEGGIGVSAFFFSLKMVLIPAFTTLFGATLYL